MNKQCCWCYYCSITDDGRVLCLRDLLTGVKVVQLDNVCDSFVRFI